MGLPPPASSGASTLRDALLAEILRDAHRYAPGLEHARPTVAVASGSRWRRPIQIARERARDRVERLAARAGFSHPHFDPVLAARRLESILALSDGLERTDSMLGDEHSRRALLDVLKLRVLGPYHAPLALTPQQFRARQAHAGRQLRLHPATFEVSDPWFTPLSLYRVPAPSGTPVTLHAHSVDVVSVFGLGQYGYARHPVRVTAGPGDVVLDIGGCWGDTALYFADLVGPHGRVYTFEFDPESLAVLRANLELNPGLAARIEVVELALWERSGERIPFTQAGRMTKVTPDSAEGGPTVETITVDDFVSQAGPERLAFVKLDVEGAELSVLRGAREAVSRHSPRLAVAAYHRDDDLVRIPDQIASLGPAYRLYLETFSPLEAETVVFADADRAGGRPRTALSNSST